MTRPAIELLLIEDNPDDEELALLALGKHNPAHAIHVIRDGAEALEFLTRCSENRSDNPAGGRPKLILLDLKLPKVGGLEILKFIKGHPALRSIPVVVLTSSREDRDIIESYALGVNSYIVKPVTFEQLVDSVRQIGLYWLLLNQTPPPGNGYYPQDKHSQGPA
ncbi:MAG: response regulator [Burkholderiales bacterium]|nr:response regulator [Burkholderiales bacterium]